jgi:hypothetical protein
VNVSSTPPTLVIIVGPIASGKSTLAAKLGARLRTTGRPVAVVDIDDVIATIGGFAGLTPARFRLAVDPIHVRHEGLLEDWWCNPPSPQGARWNCSVTLD